ncbi:MAG: hypothetical protein R6U44_04885 [Archaeoglobaceae archaeon]
MSDEVKKFVRETLGCQCPEEVFEKIEVDSEVRVADYTVDRRINVGDRLLIYLVDGDKLQNKDLEVLVRTGKEERDSAGFNRFRLVVMSDGEIELERLEELVRDYEKVHLHAVGRSMVDF